MKQLEIIDNYIWSDHKKIITSDHHNIPGLSNLSHFLFLPEADVPLHYHSDIVEMHCIVKGQRVMNIAQNGRIQQYTASSNELILTRPFEIHDCISSVEKRCEFYALQLDLRKGQKILGLDSVYSNILRSELLNLPDRLLRLGNSQLALIRTAFNLISHGNEADKYAGVSFLTSFLFGLKYLEPVTNTSEKTVPPSFQKVIQYISQNVTRNITLQELAELSGYSLSHFKFKFKEEFGITPAEYITLQKISVAEQELSSSDISITDLAYKLGFSSSNYFCTVFKKYRNVTPSEYRQTEALELKNASSLRTVKEE